MRSGKPNKLYVDMLIHKEINVPSRAISIATYAIMNEY